MTYESLINGLEEALELAKNKNEQVNILKAEVERLNGVVAELQEQVNNNEANNEPLNAKIEELEEAKAQLEAKIATLETEKVQLEADKASLQNQVVELEQAKLDAEVQHQAEVEALNEKIDELKKLLATDRI